MNIVKRFFQFSQNVNDDTVRCIFQYVDTDKNAVIGNEGANLSNKDLQALAQSKGKTTWDEEECAQMCEATLPPPE